MKVWQVGRSRLVALVLLTAGIGLLPLFVVALQRGGTTQAARLQPAGADRALPPSPDRQAPPSLQSAPQAATRGEGTTFVIVMENRSFETAIGLPYVASLAGRFAVATNYHSISSPSLPNYLAMTSGSTWGVHDDAYRVLPAQGLGDQLTQAGVSWRVYAEGFTGDCVASPYPYAVKHNPFAYFGSSCPPNIVPFGQLATDLSGNSMPRLAWIIPDLCNDGHDCQSARANQWLSDVVPGILASASWRRSGAMFLTWDEAGDVSSNRVPLIIAAPKLAAIAIAEYYDHYSLLATVEDSLGVPRLGNAAAARPFTDLLPPPPLQGR
jgi:hypothetical protein